MPAAPGLGPAGAVASVHRAIVKRWRNGKKALKLGRRKHDRRRQGLPQTQGSQVVDGPAHRADRPSGSHRRQARCSGIEGCVTSYRATSLSRSSTNFRASPLPHRRSCKPCGRCGHPRTLAGAYQFADLLFLQVATRAVSIGPPWPTWRRVGLCDRSRSRLARFCLASSTK